MDDVQIAEAFAQAHPGAFDAVVARFQRPVLNFIYRYLASREEAEDVTQDVFVRLHVYLGRFRNTGPNSLSTLTFQIARRAAIDRSRYLSRRKTSPLESAPEPTSSRSPAHDAVLSDTATRVAQAVSQLPEDQRTALLLTAYEDLPIRHAAEIMGCSEKSVESRIYRARQTLRTRLGDLLGTVSSVLDGQA